jgi:hypothetical protein
MSRVGKWVRWRRVGKKDRKGEWRRGWGVWRPEWRRGGKGEGRWTKGGGEKGEGEKGKGSDCECISGVFLPLSTGVGGSNQEPYFFPLIKPFLYTCFSGWAVLVVFDSPRAGAFNRVTGPTGRGGGRIF